MWLKKLILLGIALCVAVAAAHAQVDAGQLLEQQRRRLEQQAPPSPAAASPLLITPTAPLTAGSDATVQVRTFAPRGHSLLSEAQVQAVLAPWLGKPASFAGLRQAAAAVEQAYRDAGWLAQVSLPAQDVTEGRIQLLIAEARMGRVQLAPGSATLNPVLASRVQALIDAALPQGQFIALDTVERALLIAGEMPGVRAAGSLQAGSSTGQTDVLVQLSPAPMLRGDISADNAANRATGEARVSANLTLDAPFGRGEQLGLALSKTEGVSYLRAAASLPASLSGWRLGANASGLRYRVLERRNTSTGLAPRGSSQTAGVEATYPLVRSQRARWSLSLNADTKQQTNKDDNLTVNVLQPTSRSRSTSVSASLSGYRADSWGQGGQFNASAQLSGGTLSLAGSAAAQLQADAKLEATQGDYLLLRWSLGRTQALSANTSLSLTAVGQLASRNLNPGDKLYLGGQGLVNAYPSGEVGGSDGVLLKLELRQYIGERTDVSAFIDAGQVRQYHRNAKADGSGPLVSNNAASLKGAGLSASWRSANGFYARATYAHRVGGNPLATANGNDSDGSHRVNRVWLNVGTSF